MEFTYTKSTYQEVWNNIAADLHIPEIDSGEIRVEEGQSWILEAEEDICKKFYIKERYGLTLSSGVNEYPFRDRPPVTAISTADPAVITAVAHGLVTDNRILMNGVNGTGLSDLNGTLIITKLSVDTFSAKRYVEVLSMDATVAPVIVVTKKPHRFATGDTVYFSTNIFSSSAVATVTDSVTFTIAVGISDTDYDGNGIVSIPVSGTSTSYTGGGRFWKTDEIPSHLYDVKRGRRSYAGFILKVESSEIDEILNREVSDNAAPTIYNTALNSPAILATWIEDGVKFMGFYPPPTSNDSVLLYGRLMVIPKYYRSDSVSTNIHLSSEWENLIRNYVKSKIFERTGDSNRSLSYMQRYAGYVKEEGQNRPRKVKMQIVYR